MPPRIEQDPTNDTCPNYREDEYEPMRVVFMRAGGQDGQELTEDAAVERLGQIWQESHQRKLEAWRVQVEAEEQERRQQEEVERQREEEERQRQEEERRRQEEEAEREEERIGGRSRKLKPIKFAQDRLVSTHIINRPSPYAVNKLKTRAYVEIDYFSKRGCALAAKEPLKGSNDALGLTQVNGSVIGFQPISTLRPLKDIRQDEELTWDEVGQARHTMIRQMMTLGEGVWPTEALQMMVDFYSRGLRRGGPGHVSSKSEERVVRGLD
ncbi:hypothetical protein CVT24_007288 [Panaeolus cyanescens]|uniref:Uncharacterized protein n=1 Tax=Panaeolus cyanescens TaxID=181874 RepID=A0A409X8S1_9AGAR|nr:hypothetical protein CVT24_007288 [Panaeolus cyanescens]